MKIIAQIISSFASSKHRRISDEEQYYNQATDVIELEYRMRQVQKGLAPFQNNIRSW